MIVHSADLHSAYTSKVNMIVMFTCDPSGSPWLNCSYMHMPYYNMTLFSDPWPHTHTHAIMSPALSKKHHPGKISRFLILWLGLDLWLYPLLHCVFLVWNGDPAWEHNSNLHYNAHSCGDERQVNRRSPSKKFSQFSWWFSKISFLCECTTISYSCTFTQKAIYIYIMMV